MTADARELVVVFVELLGEGTTSFRPVIAEKHENGRFRILELPEYAGLEEEWNVLPGSWARVERIMTPSGNEIEVAVEIG